MGTKITKYQGYKISSKEKYVLKKYKKRVRVKSKDNYIDDIFLDLEITKDKNGNIINTRFPREIQDDIRAFLHEKKIMFTDTGYLSLRAACYDLKTKDRIELCRRISYKFNKDVNIEKRIKKANNFFENHKKTLATVGSGLVLGTIGGFILNKKSPSVVPNFVNSKVLKEIPDWLLGTPILGTNIISEVSSEINGYALPINLATGAIAGIAAGVVTSAGISVYRIIKNGYKRANNHADYEKINKLDTYLYHTDNEQEAEILEEMYYRSRMRGTTTRRAM